ncbi:MAG: C4-dicarboxylate transporter, DctM subunit [Frankiales bacterium]|nr:C4-dicarboxylate transporter, DctM subunit [Frankiales bacterium]
MDFLIIGGCFLVLTLLGMPVFLAMGIAGTAGIVAIRGTDSLVDVALFSYQGLNSFTLVAVPLFVLTGTLMHEIGASDRLLNFARVLVGRTPHAMGLAVIAACAVFAAISGSSVATAATMGLVALPALQKDGYSPGDRGSLLAAGGTLGILIPPSIAMIIYGVLTEQSVGKLFIAGLLPGILLALLFAIVLAITSRPAPMGEATTWSAKGGAFVAAIWVLALPLGIIALIYTGWATATEVAGIAVAYVALLGFLIYRNLGMRRLTSAFRTALLTSAMILLLIMFGQVMTRALTLARVPQKVADLVAGADVAPLLTFTFIILAYLILGTVLEATSMIIVTIPIFFPISQLIGIDPIAFGVIVVIAMEVAQITPPVGINLYVVSGVGDIPFQTMIRRIVPYVLALIVLAYSVYFFPGLATWLPNLMS